MFSFVQIFPIIAALFGTSSTPAFAFFKFMQVSKCYVKLFFNKLQIVYVSIIAVFPALVVCTYMYYLN